MKEIKNYWWEEFVNDELSKQHEDECRSYAEMILLIKKIIEEETKTNQ